MNIRNVCLPHCDTMSARVCLLNNPSLHKAVAYPLTITYTIHPPNGGEDIVITKIENYNYDGGNSTSTQFIEIETKIPFYYAQAYSYDVSVTDRCGNTNSYTKTFTAENTKATITLSTYPAHCGGYYARFGAKNLTCPVTASFLTAPSGFDIAAYNANYQNITYLGVVNFASSSQALPEGNYTVQFTDQCGRSATHSFVITNSMPSAITDYYSDCSPGTGYINYYLDNKVGVFDNFEITSSPAAFSYQNPLPYTIPASIRYHGPYYNGFVLNSLPPGNYTIKSHDNCGFTRIDTYYIPAYNPGYPNIIVDKKCGTFNLFCENKTTNGKNPSFTLYRKDTNGNYVWHYNLLNGWNNNMQGTGDFCVKQFHWHYSIDPSSGNAQYTVCSEIVSEFTIRYNFNVTDIYAFQCLSGCSDVGILAKGTSTFYNYKITKKDGQPFFIDNGTNNLFTCLQPDVYTFEIADSCKNVITRLYDITKFTVPKVTPVHLCEGENGMLAVHGLPYLNFRWWKEDYENTVLSTTYNLPFIPFNSAVHSGTYYVKLTSPTGSSCVNDTLKFIIPNAPGPPNAGEDKSIFVCNSTLSIDLNDYLDAQADNWGDWSEITNSGVSLIGSIWFPKQISPGTYKFKYRVKGICSDVDSAILTISTKDIEYPIITTCPTIRVINGCSVIAIENPIYSGAYANSSLAAFSDATNNGVATDNCKITSVRYSDIVSGTCPIVINRTWELRDSANNETTCVQTIKVQDIVVHEVVCKSNQARSTATTTYTVNGSEFDPIFYTDNCNGQLTLSYSLSGATNAIDVVATSLSGIDFNTGTTTVTWKVKDVCNNEHFCTFSVEISELKFSFTKSNVKCFGDNTGEIIIIATGGVEPLQFSIDDGNTWQNSDASNTKQKTYKNLSAGNYILKVKDANNVVNGVCE